MTVRNGSQTPVILTRQEIEQIAASAASRAVNDTLVKLGIDPKQPFEYQADMQYLRTWRNASQMVRAKLVIGAVGVLIAAAGGLIVMGLKTWLTGK